MPRETGPTHYSILGVATSASNDTIRRAYRAKAKAAHPDAGGNSAAFRRLLEAYETLNDPVARRAYDDRMGYPQPISADGAAPRGPSGAEGNFTGDVVFPDYLRTITDRPWEPGIGSATPVDGRESPIDPRGPLSPVDVAWWWPEQAVAPPVVAGPVLLATGRRRVAALDLLNGRESWQHDFEALIRNPPAVVDEIVAVWTDDGHLHGLDMERGVSRWRVVLGAPSAGGVVGLGGTLVAARADGRLVGIDPYTGTARWVTKLAGTPSVGMATGEDVVIITANGQAIEAVDVRKGRHRWRIALRQAMDLPAVVVNETVWLAGTGRAGVLARLDLATGTVRGSVEAGRSIVGMTTDGGDLYTTVTGPARLLSLDARARTRLEIDLPNVCPEPALGGGFAYLADPSARLMTVDLATSRVTGVLSLPFDPIGAPTIASDRLIFLDRDGRLWATTTSPG